MSDHSKEFAVLPLRDVVVYPHMVIPLFVGREKSIAALDSAMEDGNPPAAANLNLTLLMFVQADRSW